VVEPASNPVDNPGVSGEAAVEPEAATHADRARRRRLVLVTALGVFAAAAATLIVVLVRDVSSAKSIRPAIGAVIDLRPQISAIDVGEGGVWVSSQNSDALGAGGAPGYVWRIDPATNRVTRKIPLEDGGEGLTIAAGSVWTVDSAGTRRIDPATGRITKTIPGVHGAELFGSGDVVWVSGNRIDPKTNRVVATARAQILLAGPLGTWTRSRGGALNRIDGSGHVIATVRRAGFYPNAIGAGGGSVWVAYVSTGEFELTSIARIDPATNRLVGHAIDLRGHIPAAAAYADGRVWLLTHNEEEEGARVWQIDPGRERIVGRSLHLPHGTPFLLAAGTHSLWIAEDLDEGTVTRVDLRPS
jgi:sugar lactone lactonase YvrE